MQQPEENVLDECIYMKMSGSHFIILILYVDDILLACTNMSMLHDCKAFLAKRFDNDRFGRSLIHFGNRN
ncbi:hypothetical protein L3X38_006965 [Prunus dulcis]|uniref:Reverse transcriptase Ty1/copia-type domain-containing protein n=1 Tax=Prunus dulcis TaxID=3755 RepID=A0AAD4ZTM3_PRUDU|nr:hypothetical protein L3X38_006965 [Prunus dulcis]